MNEWSEEKLRGYLEDKLMGNVDRIGIISAIQTLIKIERRKVAQEIITAIDKEGNTGYDDLAITREWWLPFKEKWGLE